jgi:hypothetical protein
MICFEFRDHVNVGVGVLYFNATFVSKSGVGTSHNRFKSIVSFRVKTPSRLFISSYCTKPASYTASSRMTLNPLEQP